MTATTTTTPFARALRALESADAHALWLAQRGDEAAVMAFHPQHRAAQQDYRRALDA